MTIREKIGTLQSFPLSNRRIDLLYLEWYETSKRILHKKTLGGIDLMMKFMQGDPELSQGDVLFQDEECVVAVEILPCEVLIIRPKNMLGMASICYEIGNKHLPLFIENEEVMVPYDQPLFRLLSAAGYEPLKEYRKLLHPVKTTVSPHAHNDGEGLFTKIMRFTNPASNE